MFIILRGRSHIMSATEGGEGGRRMLTLVIFLMGNNSNLADMGGEGGQKSENLADIICERPLRLVSFRFVCLGSVWRMSPFSAHRCGTCP